MADQGRIVKEAFDVIIFGAEIADRLSMATAGIAISIIAHEALSELYLLLWQQLDSLDEASKWLQIKPRLDGSLLEEVNRRIDLLAPHPTSVLFADFNKTQDFVHKSGVAEAGDLAGFRDYLRDQGLRYAELADQMLVTPQ